MRGKKYPRRTIAKDPRYEDKLIAKLVNYVMISGKKTLARRQVYRALEKLAEETGATAVEAFHQALENIEPQMEVRPRRIGGAAYQIPMPVSSRRQCSLALRWLVEAARSRPNDQYHRFWQKLAAELIAAHSNEGGAVKKKEDTHRMAEANKAFSHFRW